MGDQTGSKKTNKVTACTKCHGLHEGMCRWGGDVENPPATGQQCEFREAAAMSAVMASMVARDRLCYWPRQAEAA
ncbi:MAG: hypothetical protein RLZZ360_522 [Candidatus Parcubacteria bacterium]|jgi:hypothetical protein